MLTLYNTEDIDTAFEKPLPAKTIPNHFAKVSSATEQDIESLQQKLQFKTTMYWLANLPSRFHPALIVGIDMEDLIASAEEEVVDLEIGYLLPKQEELNQYPLPQLALLTLGAHRHLQHRLLNPRKIG